MAKSMTQKPTKTSKKYTHWGETCPQILYSEVPVLNSPSVSAGLLEQEGLATWTIVVPFMLQLEISAGTDGQYELRNVSPF